MENSKKNVWWFRLCKVIFILIYSLATVIGVYALYDSNKPYVSKSLDRDNSYITCNSDTSLSYSFKDNYQLDAYIYDDSKPPYQLTYYATEAAVKACGSAGYMPHINVLEEHKGSNSATVGYSVLYLLILYVFMYIISSTFSYIAFGESFKKPKILSVLSD